MKKIFALTLMFIPKLIFAQAWAMHEAAEASREAGGDDFAALFIVVIIGFLINLIGRHKNNSSHNN